MIKICNKCFQISNKQGLQDPLISTCSLSSSSICLTKESIPSSSNSKQRRQQISGRIRLKLARMWAEEITKIHFKTLQCKEIALKHQPSSLGPPVLTLLRHLWPLCRPYRKVVKWEPTAWNSSNNLKFFKSCNSKVSKTNSITKEEDKVKHNLKINNNESYF